jgi:hypothetical protein
MGMEDFQFLLHDLAVAFREDALWQNLPVAGRFYINPLEVGLGDIEPGLGTSDIKFYCDRAIVPKPWPQIGDHLIIRAQVYEIVERDEDDIGEFAFRLIKAQLGISTVTSEGIYSGSSVPGPTPHAGPGRPTRRDEIATHYAAALDARLVSPTTPIHEIIAILRPRLGNGQGLSDRTLRKVLGGLIRARQAGRIDGRPTAV